MASVPFLSETPIAGYLPLDSKLFRPILKELHQLARMAMRRERPDHTLQPTALVNEAYLRLAGCHPGKWENRAHFFGAAARSMRQILVDHARARLTGRRGSGHVRVELRESMAAKESNLEDVVALDSALERLAEVDVRSARIVELHYYAGLTFDEAAALLGISNKTAKRDWEFARAWLETHLRSKVSR